MWSYEGIPPPLVPWSDNLLKYDDPTIFSNYQTNIGVLNLDHIYPYLQSTRTVNPAFSALDHLRSLSPDRRARSFIDLHVNFKCDTIRDNMINPINISKFKNKISNAIESYTEDIIDDNKFFIDSFEGIEEEFDLNCNFSKVPEMLLLKISNNGKEDVSKLFQKFVTMRHELEIPKSWITDQRLKNPIYNSRHFINVWFETKIEDMNHTKEQLLIGLVNIMEWQEIIEALMETEMFESIEESIFLTYLYLTLHPTYSTIKIYRNIQSLLTVNNNKTCHPT